jgi:hypothetical protein
MAAAAAAPVSMDAVSDPAGGGVVADGLTLDSIRERMQAGDIDESEITALACGAIDAADWKRLTVIAEALGDRQYHLRVGWLEHAIETGLADRVHMVMDIAAAPQEEQVTQAIATRDLDIASIVCAEFSDDVQDVVLSPIWSIASRDAVLQWISMLLMAQWTSAHICGSAADACRAGRSPHALWYLRLQMYSSPEEVLECALGVDALFATPAEDKAVHVAGLLPFPAAARTAVCTAALKAGDDTQALRRLAFSTAELKAEARIDYLCKRFVSAAAYRCVEFASTVWPQVRDRLTPAQKTTAMGELVGYALAREIFDAGARPNDEAWVKAIRAGCRELVALWLALPENAAIDLTVQTVDALMRPYEDIHPVVDKLNWMASTGRVNWHYPLVMATAVASSRDRLVAHTLALQLAYPQHAGGGGAAATL